MRKEMISPYMGADMRNAKVELISLLQDENIARESIQWADLCRDVYEPNGEYFKQRICLSPGYTRQELQTFLEQLDFDYDNGFGVQELHGKIALSHHRWLERGEYDGSEWWELRVFPLCPEHLLPSVISFPTPQ
jgi:hypothetical protein